MGEHGCTYPLLNGKQFPRRWSPFAILHHVTAKLNFFHDEFRLQWVHVKIVFLQSVHRVFQAALVFRQQLFHGVP